MPTEVDALGRRERPILPAQAPSEANVPMETAIPMRRIPETVLPQSLRDNQEDLVVTGVLDRVASDHDKMDMPIEAVVSLISIAMKRAGMITESKIHLTETAVFLDTIIRVSSRERLLTTP